MCIIIDGCGPLVACYRLAGVCGVSPRGLTLRELWWMAGGRMQAMRQHVLWQASAVWGLDKIDAYEFIRRGYLAADKPKLTMSPALKRRVQEEIGRMNRERAARGK